MTWKHLQTYKQHVSINPEVDFFDYLPARKKIHWRNFGRAEWLKHYLKSKNYKSMTIEGKPVHPVLVFIVVKTFLSVIWDFVIKRKLVKVPYLGEFFLTTNSKDPRLKEIIWGNKPHPYIKMDMCAYSLKKLHSQ